MSALGEIPDKATAVTLTSIRPWTDALYSFRTARPQGFEFTPGQYTRLGLRDASGNLIWRAYSIVSARDADFLEYYLVDVPGGAFTSLLKQLVPGDQLLMEKQSYGFMTVDRFIDGQDLWMLATGTGLGPFISILHEPDVWKKFERVFVVHSVRHATEFAYRDLLSELAARHGSTDATLRWIGSITREPSPDPACLHGRITHLLENGTLEKHAGVPLTVDGSRIMICGNPEMIDDTRKLLHQRGMRPCRRALPGQFLTENYW